MSEKMKATMPLALAVAVIAFVYVEFTANFTFHWVTNGNLGNGLSLPANFHLVIPAGFVTWGMFFVLGADNAALRTTAVNSVVGSVSALLLFAFVASTTGLPDFWTIALGVAILAFVLITLSGGLAWINIPVIFTTFAACVFWWIATGLDGWAAGGGGTGKSLAALAKPATAGTGAFGGVISTPYAWVAINVLASLLLGTLCGALSARVAGMLTPKPAATRETAGARPPTATA
ncbi:MAG: hypothetical protein M3022_14105 [Actinomycetota bacterium]|nr:hypothetical protein [Actinomycetota bacterium]